MKLSLAPKNAPPPPPPPPDVILASQSIGRKTLLEKLGIRFRVVVARIDEEAIVAPDPITMLRKRAAAKATEVTSHPRVYALAEDRESLVIAADSMAILGKKSYGRSRDREDAREMLEQLMGRIHTFVTAIEIHLFKDGKVETSWQKITRTRVTLHKLTATELESYVTRYDFTRFAAGYALGETPWDLVTKIDGSYTNVVGLPFEVLLPILRKLEIIR